jgi:hypothetical protein
VAAYLDRFGFSDEVATMYAITDGLSGLAAGPDTPGSGHNFLVHNMCRLPGSDGTWMIVRGGMGTVTSLLADAARAAAFEGLEDDLRARFERAAERVADGHRFVQPMRVDVLRRAGG